MCCLCKPRRLAVSVLRFSRKGQQALRVLVLARLLRYIRPTDTICINSSHPAVCSLIAFGKYASPRTENVTVTVLLLGPPYTAWLRVAHGQILRVQRSATACVGKPHENPGYRHGVSHRVRSSEGPEYMYEALPDMFWCGAWHCDRLSQAKKNDIKISDFDKKKSFRIVFLVVF